MDKDLVARILRHSPSGTSTKTMAHLVQMMRSGRFAKYDYGSYFRNWKAHGKIRSPEYDLSKARVPVATYWGKNDWFTNEVVIAWYMFLSRL